MISSAFSDFWQLLWMGRLGVAGLLFVSFAFFFVMFVLGRLFPGDK